MILLNSSTVFRRPVTFTLYWMKLFSPSEPMEPAAAWTFCALMALETSSGVMFRADMRRASSQMRML